MKASMQLQLGQQLTLTPQLQQAIRLLQLSTIDLRQEILEALEKNPLLEFDEAIQGNEANAQEATTNPLEANTKSDTALESDKLPSELPVDTAWEDIYPTSNVSSAPKYEGKDDNNYIENTQTSLGTLEEHLLWQLRLTPFTDRDHTIGEYLISELEFDGFIRTPLEEILQTLNDRLTPEEPIELDEVETVLHRIQRFDPVGVAARTLDECLLRQLEQLPSSTKGLDVARRLVAKHLQDLANLPERNLLRKLNTDSESLKVALCLIKTLHPKPGEQYNEEKPEYIIPDVIVSKQNEKWRVELNDETIPALKINTQYARLAPRGGRSDTHSYIRNHLQEAKWFIKSIHSRNETLLRVASSIVELQQAFLEQGEEAMKPLVLSQIAESLGIHESTISRVTTKKYMHTPQGIYELKYFFSSHVNTSSGGKASATAIRAIIKKLVAAENPEKPLSDKRIAELLTEKGINIARRTIAKYREAVGIAPSHARKTYISRNKG